MKQKGNITGPMLAQSGKKKENKYTVTIYTYSLY